MAKNAALLHALMLPACAERRPADPVILAMDDQVVWRSDFEAHLEDLRGRGLEQIQTRPCVAPCSTPSPSI